MSERATKSGKKIKDFYKVYFFCFALFCFCAVLVAVAVINNFIFA